MSDLRVSPLDIALSVLFLIIGLFACCMGYGMDNAGHGWISSAMASGLMLAAGPLAGAAWLTRRMVAGIVLANLLLLECVAAEIALVGLTTCEGWGYARAAYRRNSTEVIVWLSFWAVTHVIAMCTVSLAVFHRTRRH